MKALRCAVVLLAIAVPIAADVVRALDEAAVARARDLGERGHAAAAVVTCYSSKVRETFGHSRLPPVEMQIRGASGDIAMAAADAKRAGVPLEIPDGLKAWHLTVVAAPTSAAVVQKIVLRSTKTVVTPALLINLGVTTATFASEEARALVEAGDFQVVVELESGQRSCDIGGKDRRRLRFQP